MEERKPSRSHFAVTVVSFVITTVAAIILLITAVVIWLSYLTGSLIAATLLVGAFFAIISWIIYQLSIRDALEHLREQMATIYDVARAAQIGYKWLVEKLAIFMSFGQK